MDFRMNFEESISSIAFCPFPPFERLLVVGAYQLDESSQLRSGRLHLLSLDAVGQDLRVKSQSEEATDGIFDIMWLQSTLPTFATACSAGCISLYQCQQRVALVGQCCPFPSALATSVSARARAGSGATDRECELRASASNGELATLKIAEGKVNVTSQWKGHDLECWCCHTDPSREDVLYSGGDDCAFKGWDARQPPSQPIFINRDTHRAGVCSLASNPCTEMLLLTGSYDEHIRVWDVRQLTRPVCSAKVATGGGVWRIEYSPLHAGFVVAACMQAGIAVFSCHGLDAVQIIYDYPQQKTLAYDASWCHDRAMPVIASVTFYDRSLHIWEPQLPC